MASTSPVVAPARSQITVRTLESLIIGEKHANTLVRFAYKTLTVCDIDPKILSVLSEIKIRGWEDRTPTDFVHCTCGQNSVLRFERVQLGAHLLGVGRVPVVAASVQRPS